MARSIVGLFANRQAAEQAIVDLKNAGFDPSRIGVVMQDKKEAQEVAHEHGTSSTEGAVGGSIIGGTAGALLAATGALIIPGIGPFISGGILATALVGGAAGWLVGGLVGLGIPKEEAEYYEGRVQQGSTLVTVDAQGRDAEARQVLLNAGAEDLQAQGYGGGYDERQVATAPMTQTVQTQVQQPMTNQLATPATNDADIRVPVVEEELVVGKRQGELGRVRIHRDVVEEQQSVDVPLQRERVTVERVAVSGTSGANLGDAFQERDIDVPVMGEEAVVGKRVREVEEVRLHKEAVTEQQQVSDTVRKERVIVDGVDNQGTATNRTITDATGTTGTTRS